MNVSAKPPMSTREGVQALICWLSAPGNVQIFQGAKLHEHGACFADQVEGTANKNRGVSRSMGAGVVDGFSSRGFDLRSRDEFLQIPRVFRAAGLRLGEDEWLPIR